MKSAPGALLRPRLVVGASDLRRDSGYRPRQRASPRRGAVSRSVAGTPVRLSARGKIIERASVRGPCRRSRIRRYQRYKSRARLVIAADVARSRSPRRPRRSDTRLAPAKVVSCASRPRGSRTAFDTSLDAAESLRNRAARLYSRATFQNCARIARVLQSSSALCRAEGEVKCRCLTTSANCTRCSQPRGRSVAARGPGARVAVARPIAVVASSIRADRPPKPCRRRKPTARRPPSTPSRASRCCPATGRNRRRGLARRGSRSGTRR